MQVAAVVPAAGEGRRLREPDGPRKQFRDLGGQPVLVRTIEALERHPAVRQIVIAAPSAHVEPLAAQLEAYDFRAAIEVVAGGASRQESVACALARVRSEIDVVAVHDSVRPFITVHQLEDVFAAAHEHGAAALAIPVGDTLRRSDGVLFGETVDRNGLSRMQTPQVFRADILRQVHAAATGDEATDDVELVLRNGQPVRVVLGSSLNIKITTPADWWLARMLWPEWSARIERE
jgi:2-C-methyl-D-erythritol 4-phosphate cytidylyltransferase